MRYITSVLIWAGIFLLVIVWLPSLFLVRMFDRDPVRYRTGSFFRKLGLAISKINPNWRISIEGHEKINDRNPYIIVSNHLSNADIPVLSNLPWEMKWVAKKELFDLPILGWMMRLAGDIPVDRTSVNKSISVLKLCTYYLDRDVSVMFFPEGTRSKSGKLNRFATGAFDLAIREKKPILPIAIDGTQGCLPKKSWTFQPDVFVKLKVLEPVETTNLEPEDIPDLLNTIRGVIALQLSQWRNQPISEIDAMYRGQPDGDYG